MRSNDWQNALMNEMREHIHDIKNSPDSTHFLKYKAGRVNELLNELQSGKPSPEPKKEE